jgi:putative two-component system response regulator
LDDRESLLTGLKAGADDFISKPFDRFELRARLIGITRLNRYHKLLEEREKLQKAHERLLEAYSATIEGWSHAMDLRDQETEGHSQRVTELTLQLARTFVMELSCMTWASLASLMPSCKNPPSSPTKNG